MRELEYSLTLHSTLQAIAVQLFRRFGRKSDRRLFTLVGRPDREVICAQIIRLWAPPPGSRDPRCVLRTRRRTLTVGEEL